MKSNTYTLAGLTSAQVTQIRIALGQRVYLLTSRLEVLRKGGGDSVYCESAQANTKSAIDIVDSL